MCKTVNGYIQIYNHTYIIHNILISVLHYYYFRNLDDCFVFEFLPTPYFFLFHNMGRAYKKWDR